MKGLRANPGGNIPPNQAIGREELCRLCWRALAGQSLRLENERRLGKTTVLRILKATAPAGTRTVLMEVGGISSVTEFIETLVREFDEAVPEKKGQFVNRIRSVVNALGGVEVAGVVRLPPAAKEHWRKILTECFQGIAAVTDDRIVFFWDEVPWMVEKIKKREGDLAAVDLLDTLRDIRQTHDNIRMVFTGSIGFHHVMSKFEEEGLATRPVNDMKQINVPPLSRPDGMLLARNLLIGEGLAVSDLDETAAALHDLTGGVPYYIHHIVADLIPGGMASPELVAQKVREALVSAGDPWDMRHFQTRLKAYYGRWEKASAVVLDTLSASEESLPFNALISAVRAHGQLPPDIALDDEAMRKLLRNLMRDHYLIQEADGARRYSIQFPLMRRWWRIDRGIE